MNQTSPPLSETPLVQFRPNHIALMTNRNTTNQGLSFVRRADYSDSPRATNVGLLYDQSFQSTPRFGLEVVEEPNAPAILGWELVKAKHGRPFRIKVEVENVEQVGHALQLARFRPTEERCVFLQEHANVPELKLVECGTRGSLSHIGLAFHIRQDVIDFMANLPENPLKDEFYEKLAAVLRLRHHASGLGSLTIGGIGIEIGFGKQGFKSHGIIPDLPARTTAYEGTTSRHIRNF